MIMSHIHDRRQAGKASAGYDMLCFQPWPVSMSGMYHATSGRNGFKTLVFRNFNLRIM